MEPSATRTALASLVAAQLVVFLISLPGLGIETRTASQYKPWAGPIFLLLTILVFALGAAALYLLRLRDARVPPLVIGQAVAAIATNLLDFSRVAGPLPLLDRSSWALSP